MDSSSGGLLKRAGYFYNNGEIYDDDDNLIGTGTATIEVSWCHVCPVFFRVQWIQECGNHDHIITVDGTRSAGCT